MKATGRSLALDSAAAAAAEARARGFSRALAFHLFVPFFRYWRTPSSFRAGARQRIGENYLLNTNIK